MSRPCITQTDCQSTSKSKTASYFWSACLLRCCATPCLLTLPISDSCSKDGRPEIYLKREDLNHTGAHKINNSLGQALLCRRMGKKRVIAETGAGQHGVATVRPHAYMPCKPPVHCSQLLLCCRLPVGIHVIHLQSKCMHSTLCLSSARQTQELLSLHSTCSFSTLVEAT